MSGVRRFLSRRDKSPFPSNGTRHGVQRSQAQNQRIEHFGGAFSVPDDATKKADKDEEKNIRSIMDRFRSYGIDHLDESNVLYALRACTPVNDPKAAFQLLMLLEDTYEGIVRQYDPSTKLRGAVNRLGVSCYLDALLFAMFARLDSFEAMLYNSFEDQKRKRLAGLLRLWVNMLRTGKLITTDITEHIQLCMADMGWLEASQVIQQDPSEAFTFITGQLELPMLTLKMDIIHTGKEDPKDDHKFVHERLLEVALLDEPPDGNAVLTLENCLEQYFNNRIEIKRHLENQRRNTLRSVNSALTIPKEKEFNTHVEVTDLGDSSDTPTASTPVVEYSFMESPLHSRTGAGQLRPGIRERTDSIFSQRRVDLSTGADLEISTSAEANPTVESRLKKTSTKTEVLMPAWQFFKLLPWYTENMPTTDAQVATHFAQKRPVLGICLKRYSYTNQGQARKLDTYVDIPLEIAVPNFVGEDSPNGEEGSNFGNFRLLLQSVVCHRGVSVNSGHYISLCRGQTPTSRSGSGSDELRNGDATEDNEDPWMRFDDLAAERIISVDAREALKKELPYLLFYQVVPVDDGEGSVHDLPSYAEAVSRSSSTTTVETVHPLDTPGSEIPTSDSTPELPAIHRTSTEAVDFALGGEPRRASVDASTLLDQPRGRLNIHPSEVRRSSVALENINIGGVSGMKGIFPTQTSSSVPTTPAEEKAAVTNNAFASVAHKLTIGRGGSRNSRPTSSADGRPQSVGPERNNSAGNRFALSMTKISQKVGLTDAPPGSETAAAVDYSENGSTAGSIDGNNGSTGVSVAARPVTQPYHQRPTARSTTPAAVMPARRERSLLRSDKRSSKPAEDRDCVVM